MHPKKKNNNKNVKFMKRTQKQYIALTWLLRNK